MKNLSLVRLASYIFCIAAFALSKKMRQVMPVAFANPEETWSADDWREATSDALAVVTKKDFRVTRLSGSEVIALAMSAAKLDEEHLKDWRRPHWGQPRISLRKEEGKMMWDVMFWMVPAAPGAFFTVSIDDQTRATSVYRGM